MQHLFPHMPPPHIGPYGPVWAHTSQGRAHKGHESILRIHIFREQIISYLLVARSEAKIFTNPCIKPRPIHSHMYLARRPPADRRFFFASNLISYLLVARSEAKSSQIHVKPRPILSHMYLLQSWGGGGWGGGVDGRGAAT